jgi:hypothetical protein
MELARRVREENGHQPVAAYSVEKLPWQSGVDALS